MIDQPPESVREALIENVPILVGRADGNGVIAEIEGSIPRASVLGPLLPGKTNLLELFAEDAQEIRARLRAGQTTLVVHSSGEKGPAHFEVRVIFDHRRGSGAYFLIHDITETRELQIALLNCVDHEQMRIGQDLHDALGQELTGASYRLHALREQAPAGLSEALGELQDRIASCLSQSRDIAFKLSPHIEGNELGSAFERLCAHVTQTFEIDCVFISDLEQPISDSGIAFNLFRIAQECCTNAVRHGHAGRVEIHLVTGAKNLLEIRDDGIGFDDDLPDFPGMGIPTMKFRAEAIGGSLRLLSRQPSGTIVRCRFENKQSPETEPPTENPFAKPVHEFLRLLTPHFPHR